MATKKVRVTIEIPVGEDVPGFGTKDNFLRAVRMVVADALSEFRDRRYPPERYVAERYPILS